MPLTKPCGHCESTFAKNPRYSATQWERARYCSRACQADALRGERLPCACGCGVPVSQPRYRFRSGHNARTGDWKRRRRAKLFRGKSGANHQQTRAHRTWARRVLERDDFTCQDCGARSGQGMRVQLHAHHVSPVKQRPDLALDLDNGKTLCRACHDRVHGRGR